MACRRLVCCALRLVLVLPGDVRDFPTRQSGKPATAVLLPEGIPFALVGFYMLVGRFFVDWYQRTRFGFCVLFVVLSLPATAINL